MKHLVINVRAELPDHTLSADLAEYQEHTEREDGSRANVYAVISVEGTRLYVADDFEHARDQHDEAFPEEGAAYAVLEVQ